MKKLITITFFTTAALLIAGQFFDRCYKKFWWPFFDKLDVAIKDSTYYDGIYLGDSRVHFGINPYYVDSIATLKTYNLGMGGGPVDEIQFLAKNYLDKHPAPKFSVISIGNIAQRGHFFRNPCYYFFYLSDSATNSILQTLNYHTTLYKILPVLKYTAFDDFNKSSIAENLKGNTIVKAGVVYRGFINNKTTVFNMKEVEKSGETDTAIYAGLTKLEETIRLFAEKNTIPILVYPPSTHLKNTQKNIVDMRIDSAVSSLAGKYHGHVLHYDNDTSFSNDLFTDGWHLNIKGTILYSKKMGTDIKAILENEMIKKN